jgi:endonuclease G
MPRRKSYQDAQVQRAYRRALATYGHRPNVTAVDVGYKYVKGKNTGRLAVRIHLREKILEEHVTASEKLPPDIDGIPLDVIRAVYALHGEGAPAPGRGRRSDPIQPGISVSHANAAAGTFGTVVYDNRTGRACLLSNWHVLAGSASAHPGDAIVQPGTNDGGRQPQDTVATLERMILGPAIDAAIAVLEPGRNVRTDLFESGVVLQSARMPVQGETLVKSGRTTAVTSARVDGFGTLSLDYPVGRRQISGFFLAPVDPANPSDEEISSDGDSGAIWYSASTGEGVGLHVCGEVNPLPDAERAFACFLPDVLRDLDVSLQPAFLRPQSVRSGAPAADPRDAAATSRSGESRRGRTIRIEFDDDEAASAAEVSVNLRWPSEEGRGIR